MDHSFSSHSSSDSVAAQYTTWLSDLKPRTCLLVHWLSNLGALAEPDEPTRNRARRFAEKRQLLGRLVDSVPGEAHSRTTWLIENHDFDLYVAYLMWLRFNEYVPRRFVKPEGRARVLGWVREQLRRTELTDAETLGELSFQIERIREHWGDGNELKTLFEM